MEDKERQDNEIEAIKAIYTDAVVETEWDDDGLASGQMTIAPVLTDTVLVKIPLRERVDQGREFSGNEASKDHALDFLPPFVLGFVLPKNYPSEQPPNYTLCSNWASQYQLSELCRRLDNLWSEYKGNEILHVWAEFLRSEALPSLGICKKLIFHLQPFSTGGCTADAGCTIQPPADPRAIRDTAGDDQALAAVVEYDMRRRKERFDCTLFTCSVCLEVRAGSSCQCYGSCTEHTFCRDCVRRHVQVRLADGDVLGITCPSGSSCDEAIYPSQVKQLLPDMYNKYEQLLLQTTLNSMQDVVYCPRPHCQLPILCDTAKGVVASGNIAICSGCGFVFCIQCRKVFHGISPCRQDEDVQHLLNPDEDEWDRIERIYGRESRERVQDGFSQLYIDKNSKPCPKCRNRMEKVEGCNKVMCPVCRTMFCWKCLQLLPRSNPLRHYRSAPNAPALCSLDA